MKAHQARDQADQGKNHPEAETHLQEQNPENLSWKKTERAHLRSFYAFNNPGLQPRVIANPELTGALAQKPAKVLDKSRAD